LFIFDAKKKELVPITDEKTVAGIPYLDEKRQKIVFTAMSFEGKMKTTNDIFVYEIKSKESKKIEVCEGFLTDFVDFLDEQTLFYYGTDMKRYGLNENGKFYTYDLSNGCKTCLISELDLAVGNALNSDCRYGKGSPVIQKDSDSFYFLSSNGYETRVQKIDKTGKLSVETSMKGSLDSFTVKNGKLIIIGFHDQKLAELYRKESDSLEVITNFNGWMPNEKTVSRPEHLTITSSHAPSPDNVKIDGWILKPIPFDPDKQYPGILMIHGGPKTTYGENFIHEMQWLANEGYAVFFCNPRGSEGMGNAFADIRGKYGTIDFDDLMAFTDVILKKYPFIDPSRIGVTGGSYGGYMTNWIIGHTDRFRAAVSQRSISNWVSKFCTTDIGYFFVEDQNQATPWSDVDVLWNASPLKYADRVKTPTLFIHSEQDYRCWVPEGIQMFTALKYHGIDARLCLFRGENHELSRSGKPKHRIRRLREMKEWFDTYLK
jgi:dipeptidyl aminopeptidase/acylaminoacyl peptidase